MHKNGMEIGSHTYSHQALDGRDYDEQEADIKKGVRVIHAITGKDVSTFSYPHGRHTADTLEILKKMNFSVAVVLGGRSVTSQDHRFSIPRYDTNDIKL